MVAPANDKHGSKTGQELAIIKEQQATRTEKLIRLDSLCRIGRIISSKCTKQIRTRAAARHRTAIERWLQQVYSDYSKDMDEFFED